MAEKDKPNARQNIVITIFMVSLALVAWTLAAFAVFAPTALRLFKNDTYDYLFETAPAPRFSFTPLKTSHHPNVRLLLFPGLRLSPTQWDRAPYSNLVQTFPNAEIIYVTLPRASVRYFDDGGLAYCSAFSEALNRFLDAHLATGAPRLPTFAVGTSYGGMHALLSSASPGIDGFVSISPVMKIDRLHELRWSNNDLCAPQNLPRPLKDGIIIYGANDDRVGTDLIDQFVQTDRVPAFRSDVSGHKVTDQMIEHAIAFLSARVPK